MKLEVIAQNIQDINAINQSQADGIEFCQELAQGGLTPPYETILEAINISNIPINIMIRPTARDFNYTNKEFEQMLKDADFINKTNANGVVFGILTQNNRIDIPRMQQLIAKVPTKEKVFHKAFDLISDFEKGIKILQKLGINTVLTACGPDINKNLAKLKNLSLNNKVTVMAGGGVTFANVTTIYPLVNKIHVGTAIRKLNNWNSAIDITKINKMKKIIMKEH